MLNRNALVRLTRLFRSRWDVLRKGYGTFGQLGLEAHDTHFSCPMEKDIIKHVIWQSPQLARSNKFTVTSTGSARSHGVTGQSDPLITDTPVRPLRWGIAPVSLIADDFATSLKVLPEDYHVVTACMASSEPMAEAFAEKHKVRNVYPRLVDMARSNEVDVVYITALNPFHLEICRMMLDHGKHVLCEKPLCMNEGQALQIIGHAHTKNCFLLEGIWSRFLPAYQYMKREINDGALGEVMELKCTFGLPMKYVNRVMQKELGGGVTLELGVYAIQLAMWIFGRGPRKIEATGTLNENGIDEEANITLDFGSERKAQIALSALQRYDNTAIIKGEKATMIVQDYWCPKQIKYSNDRSIYFPLPESNLSTYFPHRLALCFEAEEVRRCIMAQKCQSDVLNHKDSITIAHIEDEVRRQLGVIYTEDVKREKVII